MLASYGLNENILISSYFANAMEVKMANRIMLNPVKKQTAVCFLVVRIGNFFSFKVY